MASGNKLNAVLILIDCHLLRIVQIKMYFLVFFLVQQEALGQIRLELIEAVCEVNGRPKNDDVYEFLWIVDFPLFLPNEKTGQLETVHHPFTAPHPDDIHCLESTDTSDQCRSLAYDLVLNGQEIGGGSIRIHNADLQRHILNDILKLNSDHLTHLIEALGSGCPPHGGIALGKFISNFYK